MSIEPSAGVRLQKVLARVGFGSRRAVEVLIEQGRVTVNGEVAVLGRRVEPESDRVEVDGVPVGILPGLVYWLVNKPAGVISTARDPEGRPTILELVPSSPRVFAVGRLDFATEGLMVLTNDGDLAQLLAHPSHGIEKEYLAGVEGDPGPAAIRKLREGVEIEPGVVTAPARVARRSPGVLRIVVHEGRYHEVRRMCDYVGHPVLRLVRTRIGPVRDPGLSPGSWRELSAAEVRALREAAVGSADPIAARAMTSNDAVEVTGVGELSGTARVPGDKSIAHRALIIAALAEGTSEVSGLPQGEDVRRTRIALAALGAYFDGDAVIGGRDRLHASRHPLDAGNSGTMARLFLGLAASLPFSVALDGDASVRSRPMDRVVEPLRKMGAEINGENGAHLPLVIAGGELSGIDYSPPVASAQVKGALLFAGIGAFGATTVHEKIATRRHTEELFGRAGAAMTIAQAPGDYWVRVERSDLVPINVRVPGDPSQAAFIAVAASIVARGEVRIEGIYIGKERLGFVDALRRMGAHIEVVPRDETMGDLVVEAAPLHATEIGGDEIPSLIDELPVLVVAACFAEGTTTIGDAAELRVKESDRIAVMTNELRALGARISERPDGFVVEGGGFRPKGKVSSHGDHRVAMALAVAALGGKDAVHIDGFSATETSWPGFLDDVRRLTCR